MMVSKRLQRVGFAALILLLLLAIAITSAVFYIHRNDNFHVVDPGRFYRSAELKPSQIDKAIQQYGIKSILNLEGDKTGRPWYDAEKAIAADHGIVHYDYHLSAGKRLTPGQVDDVLAIVREAPKPILVHCKDGSDRTGLVAALYLAEILHRDPDAAYDQLSLRYGHFKYLGSSTAAMDETFWATVDPAHHSE
jgi:protein tyrosine/serine phosphatase